MTPFRTCRDCQRELSSTRPTPRGSVRYGANGRCNGCDRRLTRALARGREYDGGSDVVAPVRAKECDVWPKRAG